MTSLKKMIELVKGDITKIAADAIVNAANTSLLGGGGVDGAIHRAGGKAILDDCRKIVAKQGGCITGEAVITTAGNLPAKFVIHTVGPVWNGGQKNEAQKLSDCYKNSLQLAVTNNCKTIVFPAISTGIYKFPKNDAAKIAVDTVTDFLLNNESIEKVIFVCFDDENEFFIKRQLNYKIYTVPSKLYSDDELIGIVNIRLEDDGMGVLSGNLIPSETYLKHKDFFVKKFLADDKDRLIRINEYTQKNNFRVIADDGTEFKEPVGGLIIYDFENEPIIVELNGIDSAIWQKYF